MHDVEAAIRERVSSYVEELTTGRDVESAGDYYTWDARLLGPGIDLDRSGIMEGIRAVFDAGTEVKVDRRTVELFCTKTRPMRSPRPRTPSSMPTAQKGHE